MVGCFLKVEFLECVGKNCCLFGDVNKNEIVDVLNDIVVLLELKGENFFKMWVY